MKNIEYHPEFENMSTDDYKKFTFLENAVYDAVKNYELCNSKRIKRHDAYFNLNDDIKELYAPDDSYLFFSYGKAINELCKRIILNYNNENEVVVRMIQEAVIQDILLLYIELQAQFIDDIILRGKQDKNIKRVYYTGRGFKPLYNGVSYKIEMENNCIMIYMCVLYKFME